MPLGLNEENNIDKKHYKQIESKDPTKVFQKLPQQHCQKQNFYWGKQETVPGKISSFTIKNEKICIKETDAIELLRTSSLRRTANIEWSLKQRELPYRGSVISRKHFSWVSGTITWPGHVQHEWEQSWATTGSRNRTQLLPAWLFLPVEPAIGVTVSSCATGDVTAQHRQQPSPLRSS